MSIEYIGGILYDEKLLESNEEIVIFGTGVCGKKVVEYLAKSGKKGNIVCFCDSNCGLGKSEVMGIPVCEPSETCKNYPNADYLISGKFSGEMYALLKEKNIEMIHILIF